MEFAEIQDIATLSWLAQMCDWAIDNGQSIKFMVDGGLKVKVGQSIWTHGLGQVHLRG